MTLFPRYLLSPQTKSPAYTPTASQKQQES